jgi:hypothetical protein
MPIDPRISLGVQQLQVPDPLAQYGQVQNILAAQAQRQSAGTQNELAQAHLAQTRMSIQEVQEAKDVIDKMMAAAKQNGATVSDPMEAATQMLQHPNPKVREAGGHLFDANQKVLAYQQQATFLKDQTPAPVAAQPDTENKLAPAPATPVNAMATPADPKQQLALKINDGDRKYGSAPGWLKQRDLLVEEYKQLLKPEFEFKEITNPDGTIGVQAINKRTAVAQPVMSAGQILTSPNIPAQRLQFDKDKLDWEKANPGKEIKEVNNADGTTSYFGIDKRTGEATPITMGAGATAPNQPLTGAKASSPPPSMVAEYTFAKTSEGGSFKGSYQDFVTARAAAGRAPAQPPQPQPPVAVVDPKTGKQIYVTREQALSGQMTPANAMEGLAPKEIQAREAKFPAATSAVKTFESSADKLAADLERLAKHPGLSGISGLIYGRTPALTKDARAAQALYDSIVARGGFQELQNMRASSPTGGALGNVSNQEGQYLRDAFAPINRTQDTADLSRSLTEAANATRVSKQRVREAYDLTYDYKNQGKAPAGAVDANNPLLKGK